MFYTKFHSPRPIFYSASSKCTRIGERASVSFLQWCSNSIAYALELLQSFTKPSISDYTLRAEQNGCNFTENIFEWIFFNYFFVCVFIQLPLNFVPEGYIQLVLLVPQNFTSLQLAYIEFSGKHCPNPLAIGLFCNGIYWALCGITRPQWVKHIKNTSYWIL